MESAVRALASVSLYLMICTKPVTSGNTTLEVAWFDQPPFASQRNLSQPPRGLFFTLLEELMDKCFDNSTNLHINPAYSNSVEMEEGMNTETFALPVTKRTELITLYTFIDSVEYLPVFHSEGPVLFRKLASQPNPVLHTLKGTWSLAVLVFSSAFLAGLIIWLCERKTNIADFPNKLSLGLWEGFWWSFVTMTTVGYGDKTPLTVCGRLFGLLWITVGMVLMSVLTASLSAAFTQESSTSVDIRGMNVGVVNGSEEKSVALTAGSVVTVYENVTSMLQDADSNPDIDGVLLNALTSLTVSGEMSKNWEILQHPIDTPSIHGILVQNVNRTIQECVAKYIITRSHTLDEWLLQEAKAWGNQPMDGHKVTSNLFDGNLIVIYITLACSVAIILLFIIWDLVLNKKVSKIETESLNGKNEIKPTGGV